MRLAASVLRPVDFETAQATRKDADATTNAFMIRITGIYVITDKRSVRRHKNTLNYRDKQVEGIMAKNLRGAPEVKNY